MIETNRPIMDISTTYEKLLQLKRVMREVAKKPSGAFLITQWGKRFENSSQMLNFFRSCMIDIKEEDIPPCNTVCCVAGWAGLDKWFQERGLTYDIESETLHLPMSDYYSRTSADFAHFFGITPEEAYKLFYSGPNNEHQRTTVRDIRKYINKLLNKYKARKDSK
jgi:hypothetical protein